MREKQRRLPSLPYHVGPGSQVTEAEAADVTITHILGIAQELQCQAGWQLDDRSWPFPPQVVLGSPFTAGRFIILTAAQELQCQAGWQLDGHSWPFPP